MKILIKNGKVVNPLGKSGSLDILIEGKKIAKIEKDIKAEEGVKIIDATNLTVMPGLVDMHVHLREPGYEYKEDILSGTRAAVAGGVTSVVCMPNTNPVLDNAALIDYIYNRAKECGYAKVYPVGCISKGMEGKELAEMGDMHNHGAVAFSDDGRPVMNSNLMRNAMEYAKNFDALLISHCEDLDLVDDGVMNEGFVSTQLGLKGNTRAAEENHVSREILLANALNTKVHIAHVSTKGGVEMIRQAKKMGIKVSAETAPHYIACTDEWVKDYNTNAKVNPPIRTEEDRLAIIEGLKDGTLDCIITDHAPHHEDEKNVEFALALNGISGLETSFAVVNTYLVRTGEVSMEKIVKLMSSNPANLVKIEGGVIEKGKPADIVIMDEHKKWKVKREEFVSKGKNSIFDGEELYGKAVYTIVDGKIMLDNYKLK
ncbi:MAG: dihydroorotase [Clostridia bacterium]|nr:dihydroorotase [Clostridia bacterium]